MDKVRKGWSWRRRYTPLRFNFFVKEIKIYDMMKGRKIVETGVYYDATVHNKQLLLLMVFNFQILVFFRRLPEIL